MKSLSPKQRRLAICAFAALAAGLTVTLLAGPFHYVSVCDRCGTELDTSNWKIPFTSVTVYSRSTQSDSPLSRVLLTNGIVATHSHHWLFAHGGGQGVKCAIGPGRHIRPAAESVEFAALVLALHQQREISFRDRVLRGAFDPDTSHMFRNLSLDAPKSRAEWPGWIAEQTKDLDETVALYKRK